MKLPPPAYRPRPPLPVKVEPVTLTGVVEAVKDDKGKVTLRQIRLGESVGQNEVEVLAGLNAGEQVALDPVKAGMAINK